MADLSIDFAGLKWRNPIGVAAHAPISSGYMDPNKYAEHLKRYVDRGASYVNVAFLNDQPTRPRNELSAYRFIRVGSKYFPKTALFVTTDARREYVCLDIGLPTVERLKKILPAGVHVMANIVVDSADPAAWARLAKTYEDVGADVIEMDVSCPMPAAKAAAVDAYHSAEITEVTGALLADHLPLLTAVVEETTKAVRIPVGVKFAPETGFPRNIGFAKEMKRVGAAFVSGINAPLTIAPPDIWNEGKGPWKQFGGQNVICASLGPGDRDRGYRNVGTIGLFAPEVEMSACGGIVEPEHSIEMIMLGARNIQLSSGIFWRGADLIENTLSFMENFMEKQGYSTVEEFRGLGLKWVKPIEDVDWRLGEVVSVTDHSVCTSCGICCENICWARSMENRHVVVNAELCTGCGLCDAVCPAEAITMEEQTHKVFMMQD